MKPLLFLLPLFSASALFTGCASKPQKTVRHEQPARASIGIQPAVEGYPQPPAPAAQMPGREGYAAESVYRMPKLRRVFLEPYVDDKGNAYGAQEMYVVEDAGGWNTEALRNPQRAYIPTAMSPGMTGPNQYVVENTVAEPVPQKVVSLRELYNLDDAIITGFVERGQEPLVAKLEAEKGGTHVRYFDSDIGWVLVPKSNLQKVHG